jgi:ketosteroid isomerase-like protein
MKTRNTFLIICLAAVAMMSFQRTSRQSGDSVTLEEIKKEIVTSNELYFQAFEKNDAMLFSNRYAEDCWIMLPNVPVLSGPTAATDFFRTGYDQFGVRGGKRITVDVYGISDDIVAEIGFWKLYDGASKEMEDGKYLVLWKKSSKGWKMWRDSFSSSRVKK